MRWISVLQAETNYLSSQTEEKKTENALSWWGGLVKLGSCSPTIGLRYTACEPLNFDDTFLPVTVDIQLFAEEV